MSTIETEGLYAPSCKKELEEWAANRTCFHVVIAAALARDDGPELEVLSFGNGQQDDFALMHLAAQMRALGRPFSFTDRALKDIVRRHLSLAQVLAVCSSSQGTFIISVSDNWDNEDPERLFDELMRVIVDQMEHGVSGGERAPLRKAVIIRVP